MAYGTYSEGYRPNGVNRGTAPQDGILASYKSDFVRNYEVGIKSSGSITGCASTPPRIT